MGKANTAQRVIALVIIILGIAYLVRSFFSGVNADADLTHGLLYMILGFIISMDSTLVYN